MSSFAIWGPSRSDLDRVAWSVAAAIDPAFRWLEVTEGGAPPSARELEVLEEMDLDRVQRVDRTVLVGLRGAAPGPRDPWEPLVGPWIPASGRGAVVLANIDRALERGLADAGRIAELLEHLSARGLSLIATFGSETAPPVAAFECVVTVRPGPAGNAWNPTVDWAIQSPAHAPGFVAPPRTAPHREVVRHLRAQRASG